MKIACRWGRISIAEDFERGGFRRGAKPHYPCYAPEGRIGVILCLLRERIVQRFLIFSMFLPALVVQSCGRGQSAGGTSQVDAGPLAHYTLTGDVQFVHDPSIIRQGQTYYVFSTDRGSSEHLVMRCSTDRQTWKICGHVFDSIPQWVAAKIPGIHDLWAPDISYFSNQFHLYYAGSIFGTNQSVIGLATNLTLDPNSPDYKWVDQGEVIGSTSSDDFNTIDPNIFIDADGDVWLTFGSYWTGIKQRRIDPNTGLLSASDMTLFSLARRNPAESPPDAIEAPFLVHHGNYYYLFVSFDSCCQGADSTYRIMVGRSTAVNGPYADMNGVPMMLGGATELLRGNGQWAGPGGQSLLLDPAEGDWIVFHAYAVPDGSPWLHVNPVEWKTDWPIIAP
jgi:arabinan endo-1,5-alpha-L-arabinosidase